VFSAHLDHIGTSESDAGDTINNGFYDNAMGIAVMLESARALSNLTKAPRRSAVFLATTAEESGELGADYFVRNPASADISVVANVNVDLPMFLFPMNTITTWGAERTSFDAAAAAEVALEGFEARPYPYPGEEGDINRSDHYPFATRGIPLLLRSTMTITIRFRTMCRNLSTGTLPDDMHEPVRALRVVSLWTTMLRRGTRAISSVRSSALCFQLFVNSPVGCINGSVNVRISTGIRIRNGKSSDLLSSNQVWPFLRTK